MDATLTLTVPSSLKQAIDEEARSQGTTLESLAAKVLRERFTPREGQMEAEDAGETMADQLEYYIGAIDGAEYASDEPRPSRSAFGKLLLDRHRNGYP